MANKAFDDHQIKPIAYPSLLAAAYPAAASKEPIVVPAPAHVNNDHRRISHTTKELHRAHVSKRRALFAPDTSKTCPISHTTTKEYLKGSRQRHKNYYLPFKKIGEQPRQDPQSSAFDKPFTAEQIHVDKPADRIIPAPGRHAAEPKDPAAQPQAHRTTSHTSTCAETYTHTTLQTRKLNLQHRMPGEQFRFRTRNDLHDKILAECEPCQKAPSRSKTSGLCAEAFGESVSSSLRNP